MCFETLVANYHKEGFRKQPHSELYPKNKFRNKFNQGGEKSVH